MIDTHIYLLGYPAIPQQKMFYGCQDEEASIGVLNMTQNLSHRRHPKGPNRDPHLGCPHPACGDSSSM